ncbi:Serine phosphatase RsbU, regulator of sigma subunit [Quadrisphaera granulorum]|uniref:Serine phosphatase RsbU (Regulator of sigma subunit) n=1 Tax=Quadrisphaera granulorum TaxID=317664 RepID=A0A316A9B2_9ACTN|nr:PP2C family protein-serine/threonine phosphatase [Quadrisphaera granulorum]PWJ53798.1 serine phosphatase RsbU (regulator of sigma subunit) [Quadrisphaera granulorum]SZE96555.1 Serine phosphatase RsbU, regulator of sigma subunit [Quadrisphaera granulorum]
MTGSGGPFAAAGELRGAYDAVDWASSPVGSPETWSTALRTALSLAFATTFPVTLLWGPRFVLLYNGAYARMLPGKHPWGLGRPCAEVFGEIWDQIQPLMQGVLDGRGAVRMVDQELYIDRRGFSEEGYFDYCYSPVTGDDGTIEGVLDIAVDTTQQVLERRRTALLRRLADLPAVLRSTHDLARVALPVLRTDPADLPLVELLVPGEAARRVDPRLAVPPPRPVEDAVVLGTSPAGRTAWLRVPGVAVPAERPLLVVGLSTGLAEDEHYLGFLWQVAAALGNAHAVASAAEAAHARADLQGAQVRRLVGLVRVLQELPEATDVEQLERVVARGAARLLGARGAQVSLGAPRAEDAATAQTAGSIQGAASAGVAEGRGAVHLDVGDRHLGELQLVWGEGQRQTKVTEEEQAVLSVLASSTAQALDRAAAREAERRATEAVRAIAEELQRSLLTEPPRVRGLDLAVRYVPAAEHAQVGGDWYDAFTTATGALQLVIGDVTGHDQRAAAAMGQLRNLLRGIAHSGQRSPAQVLAELDAALPHLGVTSLATAVLGSLSAPEADGSRELVWSSAGHLPPLLLEPGSAPRLLEEPSELLLGLQAATRRTDHRTRLPAGATVLLYTDGLVERRGVDLSLGLAWLTKAAADLEGASPDEVCDGLLDLVGGRVDDDIALLAVRLSGEQHGPGGVVG